MSNIFTKYFFLCTFLFLVDSHINAQDSLHIKRHLEYLGSDLFEGRGTGTIGGELAAKYIALNLNKNELIPMGYENTFYQYIPMHGSNATDKSEILVVGNTKDTLRIKDDFEFHHIGGRIFTPNPISMAFVGFGISAPEYNYDDYQNINVEGKVVIFLEGEPNSDNPNYFKGELPTNFSYTDIKQKIALSKGAVGTIQIPNITCKSELDWEKLIHEYYFEDITLAYLPTPLLSILLNPKSAKQLFKNSKFEFSTLMEMWEKQKLEGFELENKLLLKPKFVRRDFISPNVVGYLQGYDKSIRNEYIVISAHYDHLGIGISVKGDSVYNGVLDNAIGVSALLELTKMFSKSDLPIKRSIIFLFVTGEEKGLLGSSYFAEHLPVKSENVIANINIDGLAVFGNFKSIVGIGSEFSTLKDILKKVADDNNLVVEKIPEDFDSYESFLRSDQLSFAKAGIPSILISDGLIYDDFSKSEVIDLWKSYISKRYHTPFDDLSQTINYTATTKHIQVIYEFVKELANTNVEIKWNADSPFQRVTR